MDTYILYMWYIFFGLIIVFFASLKSKHREVIYFSLFTVFCISVVIQMISQL